MCAFIILIKSIKGIACVKYQFCRYVTADGDVRHYVLNFPPKESSWYPFCSMFDVQYVTVMWSSMSALVVVLLSSRGGRHVSPSRDVLRSRRHPGVSHWVVSQPAGSGTFHHFIYEVCLHCMLGTKLSPNKYFTVVSSLSLEPFFLSERHFNKLHCLLHA